MNRRDFIVSGAAASVALRGFPALLGETPEKFRTALIGTGWWGMNICHVAMKSGQSKIVAIGDAEANKLLRRDY